MRYDEIKKEVIKINESQPKLSSSQKILYKIETLLSDSRRYLDYYNELLKLFEDDIDLYTIADFYFLDCSKVFQELSILKFAILLDNRRDTININKFFKILISEENKKTTEYINDLNKIIKTDKKQFETIMVNFKDFKKERDKRIAHLNINVINKDFDNVFKNFDIDNLCELQNKTFNLLAKYYELLGLKKPTHIVDYSFYDSFGFTVGIDVLKRVLKRGLYELDFSDDKKVSSILKSINVMKTKLM